MNERPVLPDCCEDWILDYGSYYQRGEQFKCLECSTAWQKEDPGRFRRERDGRVFLEQVRGQEATKFHYLAAEAGEAPRNERCCTKIILQYGPQMAVGAFTCPICKTHWKKAYRSRGGMEVACFNKAELAEPFTIQTGPVRDFLVPFSLHTVPRE